MILNLSLNTQLRERLKKGKSNYMLPTKGWKKIHHANINQKEAGMTC